MFNGKLAKLILFLSIFILQPDARAQTLELLSPVQAVSVAEGDEFASEVLDNPWDMNERRDIGWEEFFAGPTINATAGVWSGANAVTGAYFFPLFGGVKGALQAEGISGERSLPRLGSNHPVNTSRYRTLSYRLRSSARSAYAIYWSSLDGPTYFPDGRQFGTSLDGFRLDRTYMHNDFQIYTLDIPTAAFESRGGSWSGDVHSIRFDPSFGAPPGAITEVDWIRLSDPTSSSRLRIDWRENSIPTGSLITVWVQGGGFAATPLARYVSDRQGRYIPAGSEYSTTPNLPSSSGRHEFSTAVLPPGSYRFFVTASRAAGGLITEIARTGLSAAVTINQAPALEFLSPSETSGADYAQEALGNPWDMSDSADVANLPSSPMPQALRQWLSPSFAGGLFQAVSEPPYPGNGQGDAQIHLPISPTRPIDTSRFRYLTYRLATDESNFPTIHDKVADGWVTRPVFWNNDFFSEGASAFGHTMYEGFHSYTIDLWDPGILERGIPWRSIPQVRHLRLDPHESVRPTWFFLDWVKLTAESVTVNNSFVVDMQILDSDSSDVSVSLHADTDASGFNGTLVWPTHTLAPGRHQIEISTAQLPPGRYFLHASLSDEASSRLVYSRAPFIVGGSQPPPGGSGLRTPFDYDGDNQSDPVVFRRGKKSRFYARPSTREPYMKEIGSSNAVAVHGDFDGDDIADLSLVQVKNNLVWWMSHLSTNGGVESRMWGVAGDEPVPADYNGDGQDDLAIFRAGVWYVLYRDGTVAVAGWGQPGDIPVPADYDGDKKADLAIWRPADGTWWVLNSGLGIVTNAGHQQRQWGLWGDIPIPGDFDSDGKHDFAVFRPSLGMWFIINSSTGQFEATQWGLPGDQPVVGDFTGDGRIDLTVYRPWTGQWFFNARNGTWSDSQWGLPGDLPPAQ